MKKDESILQELTGLNSPLATIEPLPTFSVPASYFDGLPEFILSRVKALEATTATEEIQLLSPLLSGISRKLPYSVPINYFNELELGIIYEQEPAQELELLSPLLAGLKKESPYTVPAGYFDKLANNVAKEEKSTAPVISMGKRWWKYAAAAVVATVITVSAFLFTNKQPSTETDLTGYAWIEKNMKKVSTNDIDDFLSLADATVPSNAGTVGDVQAFVKNVSDKEIQEFLNDIGGESVDDILN